MITTGIIKAINQSSNNHKENKYLVEIPLFKRPSSLDQDTQYLSNCCILGGFYSSYLVGDKVYIGFINEELAKPVILGKIYQGFDTNPIPQGFGCLNSLEVSSSAKLPQTLVIGDLQFSEILDKITDLQQHQRQYYKYILQIKSTNLEGILQMYCSFNSLKLSENEILQEIFRQNSTTPINVLLKDTSTNEFIINSCAKMSANLSLSVLNPTSKVFEFVNSISINDIVNI